MTVHSGFSLRSFNTFGIEVSAAHFAEVSSADELRSLLSDSKYRALPKLVLGGGSNILFTRDFDGLVIHNRMKGIEVLREEGDSVWVKSQGGEAWHALVLWCIERGYAGIENLSLIPGSVGAAPVQNIGAYGVELKETFHELEAIDLNESGLHIFSGENCRFGYRDSVFKHEAQDQFFILSVTLRLSKQPNFNLGYGALKRELKAMKVKKPSLEAVSQAVIDIRRRKLPDPAVVGNAGSFFKNPEVPLAQYQALKKTFDGLVAFPTRPGRMKLAAGWLIEQCGWKGKRSGRVGMHPQQALVLVNYGGTTGTELLDHARRVQQSVQATFGVKLETEVNVR